jgi:hypothetical protein
VTEVEPARAELARRRGLAPAQDVERRKDKPRSPAHWSDSTPERHTVSSRRSASESDDATVAETGDHLGRGGQEADDGREQRREPNRPRVSVAV